MLGAYAIVTAAEHGWGSAAHARASAARRWRCCWSPSSLLQARLREPDHAAAHLPRRRASPARASSAACSPPGCSRRSSSACSTSSTSAHYSALPTGVAFLPHDAHPRRALARHHRAPRRAASARAARCSPGSASPRRSLVLLSRLRRARDLLPDVFVALLLLGTLAADHTARSRRRHSHTPRLSPGVRGGRRGGGCRRDRHAAHAARSAAAPRRCPCRWPRPKPPSAADGSAPSPTRRPPAAPPAPGSSRSAGSRPRPRGASPTSALRTRSGARARR